MANSHPPPPARSLSRLMRSERAAFVRQDVVDLIDAELRQPQRRALVLSGERRMGKTTLLWGLQQALPSPSFLPVYFDLLACRRDLAAGLGELCATVAEAIDLSVAPRGVGGPDPEARRLAGEVLPALYGRVGEECRPVLLLDHLDLIDACAEGPALMAVLERLLAEHPRLSCVFAIGATAETLSSAAKALLREAGHKRLGLLPQAAARRLLSAGPRPAAVQPEKVEWALALCGGHPYFLELLRRLLADAETPEGVEAFEAMEALEERALEAAEPGCAWMWDGLTELEQAVLSAAARPEGGPTLRREDIAARVAQLGKSATASELGAVLEGLLQREVLRERAGGFSISVKLWRRWVAARKPARAPDPSLPLPEQLLLLSEAQRRRGDLFNAAALLRHALRVQEDHRGARVRLGQVLLDQGDAAGAVAELERVAESPEGRASLSRALLLQAQERERAAAGDGAADEEILRLLDRALALAPEDVLIRERRVALWLRRGERARERGELVEARRCFEEAGAKEQAEEAAAQQQQREREQAAQQGEAHEAAGRWREAAERYAWLSEQEPESPRWPGALERVRMEQGLRQQYDDGVAALARGALVEAISNLGAVVAVRPTFEEAAELLAKAVQRQRAPALTQPEKAAPSPAPAPVHRGAPAGWSFVAGLGLGLLVGLGAVWALGGSGPTVEVHGP